MELLLYIGSCASQTVFVRSCWLCKGKREEENFYDHVDMEKSQKMPNKFMIYLFNSRTKVMILLYVSLFFSFIFPRPTIINSDQPTIQFFKFHFEHGCHFNSEGKETRNMHCFVLYGL